ncbi:MAG: right-handed parallel beta-helix repeat-containing protein [Candidatus Sungbacteria bacterium]|nr:right-handed parallel beta-helix repeat-containing protein [Candidatus Sungbacteria bacterium]
MQTGDGAKFPAAPFHATLYASDPATGEIVKVTAKTTDTFTITRAQEGTTAQAFNAGDKVELLVTAKLFDDFQTRTEIIVATDGSGDYNTDGTSDQTEINEAISNLPAGGGIVHLKKGTYTIDGMVTILKSNVTLEGEGPNTIIKIASASNLGDGVRVGDGGTTAFSNIIIKNLMIDGNVAGNTTGNQSPLVIFGASATKHTKIIIENCWLTGSRLDCLKIIGVEESIVRSCHIYSNTGAGIGLFTATQYISIHGNILKSNTYGVYDGGMNYNAITGNVFRSNTHGVYLNAGWRSAVVGNVFEANSTNGVILTGGARRHTIASNHFYNNGRGVYLDSANSQWNTITGNSFSWSTTDNHIRIVLAQDNAIVGNTFHAAWTHCIELQGARFNAITGNTIFDSGRAANNTYSDIFLTNSGTTYSTNNMITGNVIRATATASANKTAYCIKENDENIDNNTIRNNDVSGAVTQNILALGRLTIDRDNNGQKKLIWDNDFLMNAYWSPDIFNSGSPSIVGALLRNFDSFGIRSANTATSYNDVTGWGDETSTGVIMNFGKRPRLKFRAKINQTTAQTIFLIMGDLGTIFQKYAGFKIINGVLSAVNSNGTTETATDISTGITLTVYNEYEVVVLSGKVLFYVNGTLKATHTTNVPSGNDDTAYMEFNVQSDDANAKFVYMKDLYFEIYA